jgi:pimeloyl-ACP methyl ester carboxylesterase
MKKPSLATRLATRVGGSIDVAILSALRRGGGARVPRPAPGATEDRRALLVEVAQFYKNLGEKFFPAPSAIAPRAEKRGKLDGGEILDLAWPSEYAPHFAAARDAYLSVEANRRACARLFKHDGGPRNTIVLLHGYRAGQFFIEERAYPVRWLYKLGLDVVLFTLPFHALRGGKNAPDWPSVNPARTNEGFGQAIFDLRALIAWLGAPSLAVSGMSLGGYTSSLLATVMPLDFVCPIIPVASFPELFWAHGEGRPERARAEREGITVELLQAAMAIHTPVLRAPKVAPEQVLVVAAEGDRIAPPEHAHRLARHFGGEELVLPGGHVLQLGRRDAFAALARRLAERGLIDKR